MPPVTPARPTPTLDQVMQLIRDGQEAAKQRWDDLKADFEAKHNENRERRHAQGGKIETLDNELHVLDGRVGALEAKLFSIVGDNSGGSGLLHEIRDTVGELKTEVASIKQTVQDTPRINRWIYGAMGVVALLVFGLPLMAAMIWEILRFLSKH